MKRLVMSCALVILALLVSIAFTIPATAQGYPGVVNVLQTNQQCPSGRGFPNTTDCVLANLQSCQNVDDLKFWYRVSSPTNGQNNGTIVLLSGFGGTSVITPSGMEDSYVTQYNSNGYYTVQIAWGEAGTGFPWEQAHPTGSTSPSNPAVQLAAQQRSCTGFASEIQTMRLSGQTTQARRQECVFMASAPVLERQRTPWRGIAPEIR